ncbi:hypothetical protein BOTCAL_1019g00010 [Botryotinia calthae]|uniref:BTB domain-containing protein n=1 Tax=Botryotinia calthae TaxID=38488 RepID=A0A4Y8CE60_9HELO|nr:hypothetical protein BOTCAL_1019g00010 [Botryotinia calthae]
MYEAQNVIDTITRCFDNGIYSDLIIKCRNRSWNVHRLIVCSQSKVLHAACMTGFKEADTGVIELNDDDPVSVEIMLKYFYTGTYKEQIVEGKKLCLNLKVQVLTYNLADKYDVPNLMGLLKRKFESTLDAGPALEEFLSVVSDVYVIPTSTNILRPIIVEYARRKFRSMIQSDDPEILRATLQDVPDFAFDLLQLFINDPLRGHCSNCGSNKSAEVLQARCVGCGKGGVSMIF